MHHKFKRTYTSVTHNHMLTYTLVHTRHTYIYIRIHAIDIRVGQTYTSLDEAMSSPAHKKHSRTLGKSTTPRFSTSGTGLDSNQANDLSITLDEVNVHVHM
jgi:hypothetical protein